MLMHGIMQLSARKRCGFLTDYYCFINHCYGKPAKDDRGNKATLERNLRETLEGDL